MPSWADVSIALAVAVLAAHLAFILWVIFGAAVTGGRRALSVAHILSLLYGVVIEAGPWPCPLTLAENWLEAAGGKMPYRGPFLLHYLDLAVYPHVPGRLLTWLAVAVLAANAWIYGRRWRRAGRAG